MMAKDTRSITGGVSQERELFGLSAQAHGVAQGTGRTTAKGC